MLPEKKKTFPMDDDAARCCSVKTLEDIPDDIMDATKSLILKKEEEMSKFNMEQLQITLQTQQNQIDKIESQIQLLLQLCSKK